MSSAFIGNLVAGVLSTGVKSPEMVYKGDDVVNPNEIFIHAAVAPQSQPIKAKINRNGTPMQKSSADAEIEIAHTTKDGSITGLDNVTVTAGDVFAVNPTQVGTTPNEGSDLEWGVVA